MPVEIKELVIRAVAEVDREGPREARESTEDRASLVEACVREVLRILRRAEER